MPLLLGICLAWQIPLRAEESPLVMGVFPRKGFTRTIENFTPLADYLSSQLGRKVILESGRNFAEFWQGVEQRRYDLVHYNQYHYVRSHKNLGYDVIAKNEENHRSTISGVLIVRKDSGIKNVAELRGKKIIFGGGRDAMQGYIIASYLLQQAGLPKDAYQAIFAGSPPNAIYATYYRQAGAAGSAGVNLELPMLRKNLDISQLKILARSDRLAQLPWAVKSELSPAVKAQLTSLLTNLSRSEAGRRILKRAGLTAIIPAKDNEYDPHRKIIKLILGEDY